MHSNIIYPAADLPASILAFCLEYFLQQSIDPDCSALYRLALAHPPTALQVQPSADLKVAQILKQCGGVFVCVFNFSTTFPD